MFDTFFIVNSLTQMSSIIVTTPPRLKKENVFFLKSHKAAGTTLRNILEVYAHKHDLVVALPTGENPDQFKYPYKFSDEFVLPLLPHQSRYNMLFHHMRFLYSCWKKAVFSNSHSSAMFLCKINFERFKIFAASVNNNTEQFQKLN